MNVEYDGPPSPDGWAWFAAGPAAGEPDDTLTNAAVACFAGRQGELLLRHLDHVFLQRRVPPSASDAVLRHVEGQRSAIAYLIRLARPRG